MDTRTAGIDVEKELQELKTHMPETYKTIVRTADEIGPLAYALVRRGLKGQPNCFYAVERGYVKGTPFSIKVGSVAAEQMLQFGCQSLCMFPLVERAPAAGEVAPK